MLSGVQIRMARAALGWGVRDLGRKADVNPNTITRIEGGSNALADTLAKIEAVFTDEGIRFTDDGGVCPPKS